jgi:hypothetical protein
MAGQAPQPSEPPGDPASAPQQEGEEGGSYTFGRRQWPSQERAEQEFLTNIGRLQAAQRRVAELEQTNAALLTAQQQGGAPAEQGGQSPAPDGGELPALPEVGSFDWEMIQGAIQKDGADVGVYLFAKQLLEKLGPALDQRFTKMQEPLQQVQRGAEHAAQTEQLWQSAAVATDEGGQLYFPELADPNTATLAVQVWREMTHGMPPEAANRPQMVRAAMLELRSMMGQQGAGNGQSGAGGVDPNAVAAAAAHAQAQGAQPGVLPPGGRQQPPGTRPAKLTEEQRIQQSLVRGQGNPLGFSR